MPAVRALQDPIAACVAGALAIAGVELAALGSLDPWLIAVVASLMGGVGFAVGAVVAAQELLARRASGLRAAAIRGLGALAPLVFVARTLFEGARASQMPGAASAHVWLPAAGYAALVGGLWLVDRAGLIASPARRRAVALALALLAAGCELANRRLFRSEYADVHAFLIVMSSALAGLSLWLAAGSSPPSWGWRRAGAWMGALGVLTVGLALVLVHGLEDRDRRWRVSTRGNHARHLTRLVRALFDGDGDGYSPLLGGGDCDDHRRDVSPAASEILGNGRDEDCDGHDLAPAAPRPEERARELSLAEWQRGPDATALRGRTQKMNMLVLAVDALRADVSLSPEGAEIMPNATALFADSVVFSRAFATSAGTDVSVSSVITGRLNPFVSLPLTLPEALRAAGRRTAAVLPSEVLRYAGSVLLGRGIDDVVRYVNDAGERDVSRATTTDEAVRRGLGAIDTLIAAGKPFYLWLHLFDVHEHMQVEPSDPRLAELAGRFDIATRAGKYRALAAVTDGGIGKVLRALDDKGIADNTIVVIISDHGESLGESPRLPDNHGRFVYNALTHVPLAIRIPGVSARRVDKAVSLIDLTPTLLELAGAELFEGLDGRSLLPFIADAPSELRDHHRPLVLNESEQWGLIDWPLKLMVRPAENLIELYDLEADFEEARDLSTQREADVRALKARYATFPQPSLDRTRNGRKQRDELARPPSPP